MAAHTALRMICGADDRFRGGHFRAVRLVSGAGAEGVVLPLDDRAGDGGERLHDAQRDVGDSVDSWSRDGGQNAIKPGMTTDTVVPKRQRQVDREPADSAADLGVRGGIGRCTQRTFVTFEVGT